MAVRIVLIEDNDVFRQALELLLGLRADFEVVASAPDGCRAAELCLEHRPDVVVVDYRLPGLDGVQVTRLLRERCPQVAVVALTAAAGERELQAMREAGAAACVGKDESLDEIVEAIRTAAGS